MKRMFYLAIMALCCVACEDKEENQYIDGWVRPMYVSINSEVFNDSNHQVSIVAEEGGEFTVRTEFPSRVAQIYEYGDSFDLPIGKEYGCLDVYIDGVRHAAYGTYFYDRMTYGAQNELIDPQYPWSYLLPWSFDHREWYEIVQLEDSTIQLTVKPCNEHRFLCLRLFSIVSTSAVWPFGVCSIECVPASEIKE